MLILKHNADFYPIGVWYIYLQNQIPRLQFWKKSSLRNIIEVSWREVFKTVS